MTRTLSTALRPSAPTKRCNEFLAMRSLTLDVVIIDIIRQLISLGGIDSVGGREGRVEPYKNRQVQDAISIDLFRLYTPYKSYSSRSNAKLL